MRKNLKISFSKLEQDIYKFLLFLYFLLNGFLIAVQILLVVTKILGVEVSWVNLTYLKVKYGSSYWLTPLGAIITILIATSINLLDYRYEFLPNRYGYKYSLRKPENVVKQIRIDRITCGISNIFFFILLSLMVIKGYGAFINPPLDVPDHLGWIIIPIYILITIIYHIKSNNLSKLDKQ